MTERAITATLRTIKDNLEEQKISLQRKRNLLAGTALSLAGAFATAETVLIKNNDNHVLFYLVMCLLGVGISFSASYAKNLHRKVKKINEYAANIPETDTPIRETVNAFIDLAVRNHDKLQPLFETSVDIGTNYSLTDLDILLREKNKLIEGVSATELDTGKPATVAMLYDFKTNDSDREPWMEHFGDRHIALEAHWDIEEGVPHMIRLYSHVERTDKELTRFRDELKSNNTPFTPHIRYPVKTFVFTDEPVTENDMKSSQYLTRSLPNGAFEMDKDSEIVKFTPVGELAVGEKSYFVYGFNSLDKITCFEALGQDDKIHHWSRVNRFKK